MPVKLLEPDILTSPCLYEVIYENDIYLAYNETALILDALKPPSTYIFPVTVTLDNVTTASGPI